MYLYFEINRFYSFISLFGPYLSLLTIYTPIRNDPTINYYNSTISILLKVKQWYNKYPKFNNEIKSVISAVQIILANIIVYYLNTPIDIV